MSGVGKTRTWKDVHPTIRALYDLLTRKGFRITSVVRPNASSHASGRAIDVARRMYDDDWADWDAAKQLWDLVTPVVGTSIMVVGEDDHIHIGTAAPHGVGYDGKRGTVLPRKI
jgi:hypothetical protein